MGIGTSGWKRATIILLNWFIQTCIITWTQALHRIWSRVSLTCSAVPRRSQCVQWQLWVLQGNLYFWTSRYSFVSPWAWCYAGTGILSKLLRKTELEFLSHDEENMFYEATVIQVNVFCQIWRKFPEDVLEISHSWQCDIHMYVQMFRWTHNPKHNASDCGYHWRWGIKMIRGSTDSPQSSWIDRHRGIFGTFRKVWAKGNSPAPNWKELRIKQWFRSSQNVFDRNITNNLNNQNIDLNMTSLTSSSHLHSHPQLLYLTHAAGAE